MYTSCDLEKISCLDWTCPRIISLLMLHLLGKFVQNCCFYSNNNLDTYGENCGEKGSIDIPNESILKENGIFSMSYLSSTQKVVKIGCLL